jgi:hypothetical protein
MYSANYHIQPNILTKLFDLKVYALSSITNIVRSNTLFRTVAKHITHTGFVLGVNKDLTKIFLITEGLKSVINSPEYDKFFAKADHQYSKNSLLNYRQSFARLEKSRFFKNGTTRRLSNSVLDNLYKLEYELRKIAFDDQHSVTPEDSKLRQFASELSLSSLN